MTIPSVVRAILSDLARRWEVDPEDLISWVYRQKAPPTAIRDALVAAFFPRVSPEDFLPSSTEGTKLRGVTPEQSAGAIPTQAGRPIEHDHPFTEALKKANMTVVEWCNTKGGQAAGYGYERVKSWYRTAHGRPIPRAAAEAIERQFPSVKATKRTWRNGIR